MLSSDVPGDRLRGAAGGLASAAAGDIGAAAALLDGPSDASVSICSSADSSRPSLTTYRSVESECSVKGARSVSLDAQPDWRPQLSTFAVSALQSEPALMNRSCANIQNFSKDPFLSSVYMYCTLPGTQAHGDDLERASMPCEQGNVKQGP